MLDGNRVLEGVPSHPRQMTIGDIGLLTLLPDHQLAALVLVAVRGLSYEDTHKLLNLKEAKTTGTVKSRVARARAGLQELLGEGTPALGRVKLETVRNWHRDTFTIARLEPGMPPINPGIEDELALLQKMASADVPEAFCKIVLKSLSNARPWIPSPVRT